jgi:type VI protein secretion system component Hcp
MSEIKKEELKPEDDELTEEQLKEASGGVEFHDITITKTVDKSSTN